MKEKPALEIQIGDVIEFKNHAEKPILARVETITVRLKTLNFRTTGCYIRAVAKNEYVEVQ